MKKGFVVLGAAMSLFAVSCKEVPVEVDMGNTVSEDTSYVNTTVSDAQIKNILVEEESGVQCVNCPTGALKLEELNNQHGGKLKIVTIHAGSLTLPIPGKSVQDLVCPDATALLAIIGEGNKPCSGFDRLPLGSGTNKYMVENFTTWASAVDKAIAAAPNTPINIDLTSKYNGDKDQYDIEVKIEYTQPLSGQQMLNIYLTESDIVDAQKMPDLEYKTDYIFNHVLRDIITPISGKQILPELTEKEAGRVYVYRTAVKIPEGSVWKAENMSVTAFVSNNAVDDIQVYQTQDTKLKK